MSLFFQRRSATISYGSTNYVGPGRVTSGDLVYGFNGGTNAPAVDLASGGIISGATAMSGGVVAAAANGTTVGGTALESGSFAALNQGVVISPTITARAGLAVGNLANYQGTPARAIAPHVMSDGQAIVGGGFTVKGQSFSGSGVISGGTFDVGSTEQLASGGTDSGSFFGGTQIVSSGALALNGIFSAGVQLINGGSVSSSVVSAGGTVFVGQGGRASTVTVGSGGTAVVGCGGLLFNQIVLARAASIVSAGGTVSGATIASGGSETVQSGGVVSGATVLAGGTQDVQAGATVQGAIVSAGGSMILASGATVSNLQIGAARSSDDKGGKLIVTPGAVLRDVSVGWRGAIDIEGLAYRPGGSISFSNGVLTVTYSDGSTWSTPLNGSYRKSDFHLESDGDGSTMVVYDKCFLAGTMIGTPFGERLVETLSVGDLVSTAMGEAGASKRITWIGSAEIIADSSRSDDQAGYPVRFKTGSIGPHSPDRDLCVTSEHCIFLDGALVPARMLVNGTSIDYDRSQTRFMIYHFKTEDHAIVWSNNMATETLLDGGERHGLRPDEASRMLPHCETPQSRVAPLRVERDFVEPLHRALAERGNALSETMPRHRGNDIPARAVASQAPDCQDPDLHLVSEEGQIIRPLRSVDDMVIFHVPTEWNEVRIRSRAARPSEAEGPFVDDRRALGVLIGDIHLWDSHGMTQLDTHLSDDTLDGWNGIEGVTTRWTKGDARLPLGRRRTGAPGVLGIKIKATAVYERIAC
ncbi:Hint domain-containing protein [Asaia sp. BMEF1]|uniref:Hint domain-containing protein n=1 Tax=Asaia sp. BMEF1 TaxID=3155932 RepID=UPI003F67FE98